MSSCTHDERFKDSFGCPNGCLACKCESLARALSNLVKALDVCDGAINSAFTIAYVHGVRYPGPGYGVELEAAKEELGDAVRE